MTGINEADRTTEPDRRTAWLSRGLASLQRRAEADRHFDVVVVGSGYGAAVAAAELAGARKADGTAVSVCVLERGREHLPGSFPSRMSDLAGHIRYATPQATQARGNAEGLFDVRLGGDVGALVANGLGGGSLINAGVLAAPRPAIFAEAAWPAPLRRPGALEPFLEEAGRRLGARRSDGRDNTIDQAGKSPPLKFGVMRRLSSGQPFTATPISVGLEPGAHSSAGVRLETCLRCGDCATGCNHGAKNSLDVNLLAMARDQGAEIFTGATVLSVAREGDGWCLQVVPTEPLQRRREGEPTRVSASIVILAAGTLGSTEILLRSTQLERSPQLGRRFSANGDMIAVAYDLQPEVRAVATETDPPDARDVGPTITAMIDGRTDDPATDLVVQDLSIPGPLRRLLEECATTMSTLDALDGPDRCGRRPRSPAADPCAIDPRAIAHSLPVAMIGRDDADGRLRFDPSSPPGGQVDLSDGTTTVDWPAWRDDARLVAHHERLAGHLQQARLGGRVLANPMWRPLPASLDTMFGLQKGPLLTVHPLGGCAMADDAASGVVTEFGEVFAGARGTAVHPGLLVLDGAIVPASLGINPALTIAALALRAVRHLRQRLGWTAAVRLPTPQPRPIFRPVPVVAAPRPTTVELIERLRGPARLKNEPGREVVVEWTLRFAPKRIDELFVESSAAHRRRLHVADGRLRILTRMPSSFEDAHDQVDAASIAFEARLSGTLDLFHEEVGNALCRSAHALPAWALNRGLRDLVQGAVGALAQPAGGPQSPLELAKDLGQRLGAALNLSTHAGAVRLMTYRLRVGDVLHAADGFDVGPWRGAALVGVKRLTYDCGANPWRQLTQVALNACPGLAVDARRPPVLALQLPFLAARGVPLLRVLQQHDHPAALVDLASLCLYLVRILLRVHLWSFRLPDPPVDREPDRLPGVVPGLPLPETKTLRVPASKDGAVVGAEIRLTRYLGAHPRSRPVLLIHGYSASGTTFAHPAIPCSLAGYLCNELQRDVWIVDLRSSAGMPTARQPWALEDVGCHDIPWAIRYIRHVTQQAKVDVVAHCMGAAMVSMALLDDCRPLDPAWIGRLVLSQVGPAVVMSPSNQFRAYLMRYLQHYLSLDDYAFRPPPQRGLGGQLLDRLLATLPYPPNEFDLENPVWPPGAPTPWVGTRHRMDALYGRDFELANMPATVLDHIDDFFGPLSLHTVTQVIHFARFHRITDRRGVNRYTAALRVRERIVFPVLSVHGEENGLADKATLDEMALLLARQCLGPGGSFASQSIPGYGHQDCLVGTHARRDVFGHIGRFLES